jgi:hypothetical protein
MLTQAVVFQSIHTILLWRRVAVAAWAQARSLRSPPRRPSKRSNTTSHNFRPSRRFGNISIEIGLSAASIATKKTLRRRRARRVVIPIILPALRPGVPISSFPVRVLPARTDPAAGHFTNGSWIPYPLWRLGGAPCANSVLRQMIWIRRRRLADIYTMLGASKNGKPILIGLKVDLSASIAGVNSICNTL